MASTRGMIQSTMVLVAVALTACGSSMTPSGGSSHASGANASAPSPTVDSADQTEQPGLLQELANDAQRACQEQGIVYDRRQGECSGSFKLTTAYTCDRAGLRQAFANTGFQIDQILDRSIGREGFADDLGEGYVIDQCGESDTRRIVYLVAKDDKGRYLLREVEAALMISQ